MSTKCSAPTSTSLTRGQVMSRRRYYESVIPKRTPKTTGATKSSSSDGGSDDALVNLTMEELQEAVATILVEEQIVDYNRAAVCARALRVSLINMAEKGHPAMEVDAVLQAFVKYLGLEQKGEGGDKVVDRLVGRLKELLSQKRIECTISVYE